MRFEDFFAALWEGNRPFPWQERLAEQVVSQGWPKAIGLPTAAGKTALIDIAVYALAEEAKAAARRIFFVVDRRVIVDEAAERAAKIAARLAGAGAGSPLWEAAQRLKACGGGTDTPLATAVMRGGIARDDAWAESPLQPAVICSTVDQVGSAVLFRAYGASEYAWPIRAGLAAHDALIILDEAHVSQPFAQTLERVRRYATWGQGRVARPLQVVEMTATPRTADVFRETAADRDDATLRRRWFADKRAELVVAAAQDGEKAEQGGFSGLIEALASSAMRMRDEHGARAIGVIANRVRTARAVHAKLAAENGGRAILLTGRARAWDRDRIWREWRGSIELGREQRSPEAPVFVVATQSIEVGANVDFDALATECASIDALEQRFGRLNRGGRPFVARAAIVAQKDQTASRYEDAVYGPALAATWTWLKERERAETREESVAVEGRKKPKVKKVKERWAPVGTVALREELEKTENRAALAMARPDAPVLMPAHLDLLCQTSPEPAVVPDTALFLHGPQSGPADVQIVWRADLGGEERGWAETVAVCPPSAAEAIAVPAWLARAWLKGAEAGDCSDLEGAAEQPERKGAASRRALCWHGPEESSVVDAAGVRPGMTLIVPAAYGGCDEWGWNPEWTEPVRDVGDAVKLRMGRPVLRLDESLASMWGYEELAAALRREDVSVEEASRALANATVAHETVRSIVNALAERPVRLLPGVAVIGRGVFDQGSGRSAHIAREVGLQEHLAGCAAMAERFAGAVDENLRTAVRRAAEMHDIGKADPRFQAWLRGGNPVRRCELIAKSARSGENSGAVERARAVAGYPKGARHELASVALIGEKECDLVLHLIAAHHGRCRPFAPCIADDEPVEISYGALRASSVHGLERAGSGIATRFWRLTREYGWYGLAYLEAVLRLADQRRSEAERERTRMAAHA